MDTASIIQLFHQSLSYIKEDRRIKRGSMRKKPKDRESKENSKTRDGRQNRRLGKIGDSLSGEER
jgi:hypothetical protein